MGEAGAPDRLQRGEARPLDRAHHAGAVGDVHGGIDGETDEANADHAGETGARHPFQAAVGAIVARFAEIDLRQLALELGGFAEENGGESTRHGRHECLTKFSARKTPAAVKQCAFPPSTGRRPRALFLARFLTSLRRT
jgi:hypothetical protein